jgi:23S rRNA pseudouridine1911/1915/1917 synthase
MEDTPGIVAETDDYAVLYKPPFIHSAPLYKGEKGTLLAWYEEISPPRMPLAGRKNVEGGLIHRLDYETSGLVLAAKNQRALDLFLSLQAEGGIIKEYEALSEREKTKNLPPGFPPAPFIRELSVSSSFPVTIESFFRAFGPERKQVRPKIRGEKNNNKTVSNKGTPYRTSITNIKETDRNKLAFTVRIQKGFRHQIRCHLAWIGYPILNDPLYGAAVKEPPLALCAKALYFCDPITGKRREYRI